MLELLCPKRERIARLRDEKPRALAIMRDGPDRQTLQTIFRDAGWELEAADSMPAALVRRRTPFPMILLERELQDCDWRKGVSVLAALPQQPWVILLSGRCDKNLWDDLIRYGGSDILRVPFVHDSVIHAISSGWSFWRHLQQLRRATARRA